MATQGCRLLCCRPFAAAVLVLSATAPSCKLRVSQSSNDNIACLTNCCVLIRTLKKALGPTVTDP